METMTGEPSAVVQAPECSARLRIHVVFTSLEETRIALRRAEELAAGLNAEIALILTPIVPFPLPLEQPPTPVDFAQSQIHSLTATADTPIEAFVYLCRDPLRLLASVLPPHALLIIGTNRNWAFGRSKRLARALQRNGHHVITARR
jgi:hypothetical protein